MNTRTKALLATLLAVGCSVAYAASYNRVPNVTFANLNNAGTIAGNLAYVTDCNAPLACTAGGGTDDVLFEYNGSAWVPIASAGTGGMGALTGTTANSWTIDSDANNEKIDLAADDTFDFTRDDAGTVTITASDDDATAALTILPGGAAALTLGGASTTSIANIGTDVQVRNGATGNVDLSFRDYADTTDDDQAHVLLRSNCTDASTGAEDCDFSIGITEAGAAPETRLNFDADGDITIGSANNAGVIFNALNTQQRNNATGTVTLAFADYADTTDDDQDHGRIQVNCTDTGSGTEDCDLSLSVVEGGAAPESRLVLDGDGGITLGSANTNILIVTTDSTGDNEVTLPADSIGASEIGDDVCTSVIAVSYNPTEAGATDDYVSLIAVDTGTGDASFSATETAEDQFIAPVALRAANLRVDTATAPGAGNDAWVITLREAAGSTALTCTIDEAATSCTDTTNIDSVAAGAALDLLVTSSTGGGADPTASAEMRISFCLTAD